MMLSSNSEENFQSFLYKMEWNLKKKIVKKILFIILPYII